MSKLLDYRSGAGAVVSLPGKNSGIGTTPVEVLAAPTSIMSIHITGIVIGNKTANPINITLVEDTGSTAVEISCPMPLAAYESRCLIFSPNGQFPNFIQASAGVNVGAKADQDDSGTIMIFGRVDGA
jgi:hypothetical protein